MTNTRLLSAFFLIAPVASVFSSNALVPLVIVFGVLGYALTAWKAGQLPRFSMLQCGLFLLFFGWTATTLAWTINFEEAAKLTLRLAGLTIAGLMLVKTVESAPETERPGLSRWLLSGTLLAVLFIAIEVYANAPITRLVKGIPWDEGLNLSRFNRGVTFLTVTLWALLGIYAHRLKGLLKYLIPIAATIFAFTLTSESSFLALLLALVWYLLFARFQSAGRKILLPLVICSIVAMPMLVKTLSPYSGPQVAQQIPTSAKHRLFIWDFVADQIFDQPLQGWGFDAARDYPNKGRENFSFIRHDEFEQEILIQLEGRIISLHPHNGALQIWLELGFVGIVLATAVFWALFRYIDRLSLARPVIAQAMVVNTFIIALLGYGVWQNRWFVMFFIFAAMLPLMQRQKPSEEA